MVTARPLKIIKASANKNNFLDDFEMPENIPLQGLASF
jgi:hypothetical protein